MAIRLGFSAWGRGLVAEENCCREDGEAEDGRGGEAPGGPGAGGGVGEVGDFHLVVEVEPVFWGWRKECGFAVADVGVDGRLHFVAVFSAVPAGFEMAVEGARFGGGEFAVEQAKQVQFLGVVTHRGPFGDV